MISNQNQEDAREALKLLSYASKHRSEADIMAEYLANIEKRDSCERMYIVGGEATRDEVIEGLNKVITDYRQLVDDYRIMLGMMGKSEL